MAFQFLMVRLKETRARRCSQIWVFQFLMVRLKEGTGLLSLSTLQAFQFLMVRLKGTTSYY